MPVIVDDEELRKRKTSEDRNVSSKLSLIKLVDRRNFISSEAVKLNFSNYREFLLELVYIISFIYFIFFPIGFVCIRPSVEGCIQIIPN